MHLFEDLVITEVVDADNQPVPPGEYGAKVLVTALFTQRAGRSGRPAQDWRFCLLSRTTSTHRVWRVISARPWRPKESSRLRCTSVK